MANWSQVYSNPVVLLAVVIVVSIILLIGASVIGFDRGGVLVSMGKSDFARGLITYLFALVTIGIAVALVLSALTGTEGADASDVRFQRGKEILSLLLGLFGTMVGFYFGSEASAAARSDQQALQLSALDVTPQPVSKESGKITVRAVVKGGATPYRYAVVQRPGGTPDLSDIVRNDGWIVHEMTLNNADPMQVRVVVQDAAKRTVEQAVAIKFTE